MVMADYNGNYVYLNTHEFKNNIAHWTRLLQRKCYKAVLVKRHDKVVGVYATNIVDELDKIAKAERAQKEGPKPVSILDESIFS